MIITGMKLTLGKTTELSSLPSSLPSKLVGMITDWWCIFQALRLLKISSVYQFCFMPPQTNKLFLTGTSQKERQKLNITRDAKNMKE